MVAHSVNEDTQMTDFVLGIFHLRIELIENVKTRRKPPWCDIYEPPSSGDQRSKWRAAFPRHGLQTCVARTALPMLGFGGPIGDLAISIGY